MYLGDHWHVDEEADDAADGRYHLSPQGAQGRFRGKHVHDSCYQTLYPYKLKTTTTKITNRKETAERMREGKCELECKETEFGFKS